MKREKEIKINNMPKNDMFIIINPEEIGKIFLFLCYLIILFWIII